MPKPIFTVLFLETIEKENHSNIEVVTDNTKEEKKEETIKT